MQLTTQQQQAVDTVLHSSGFQCFLLEGITGSGKTEVYLELAQACVEKGRQVLVLVPEISLTPQMMARFEQRLSAPSFKLHSRMAPQQRFKMWLAAKQGVSGVWIGTRSAIFTPFLNLGLVVVDEEHDFSFKQQTGFRYSGRDLAVMRGKFANIPVVLGSATPSLETLHNVIEKRYQHLQLTERVGEAVLPQIKLIDMRNGEEGILSPILQKAIRERLDKNQQVLLFVNRRGFAPVLMCHRCGWIAGCKHCDVHMVTHQHPPHLACHHCGLIQKIITRCTKCDSTQLFPLGFGSQRLENVLKETFLDTTIVRIDSDTTRKKGELEKQLSIIQKGEPCILVGTQMLAKGHHFPNLTLVAILDVDAGLLNPDFRAPERMGQLLTQVSGRAGRGSETGLVLIQTHHSDHPLLHSLLAQGYSAFARKLLVERKESELPPVTYMAHVQAESRQQTTTLDFLQSVREFAKKIDQQTVEILGPIPAPIEKKAGQFRAYLNLLCKNRRELHQTLEKVVANLERDSENHRRVRWLVEVDPSEVS